jgi:hypothetical protein
MLPGAKSSQTTVREASREVALQASRFAWLGVWDKEVGR